MPYIKQADRERYDGIIGDLIIRLQGVPWGIRAGLLNYAITRLLVGTFPVPNYATHNAIIGVLECCKQEWYRRKVAPYEDQKIKENGDVT